MREVSSVKRNIVHKIDPLVRSMVKINSHANGGADPVRVILYAKEYERCRPTLDKLGITIFSELPLIDGYVVEVPYNQLARIAGQKNVRYITADLDVQAQMDVATKVVGADALQNAGVTGRGVGIAFIDTGIYPHPDFTMPKNRIAAFVDIVNSRTAYYDDNGHGTFVAGVAAGSGSASSGKYRGIAPGANIIALKVMDANGGGRASDVLGALQWIAYNHKRYNIKVVSMSLGSDVGITNRDDAMERGVEQLWRQGITIIAAAGNSGPHSRTITVPGTSPMIVTVGSNDDRRTVSLDDDIVADFSSRGPVGNRPKPDILAPGVDIHGPLADTTYLPGRKMARMSTYYTAMKGTSVSTPIVAGIAALYYEQNPSVTPDEIKRNLITRARRLTGQRNQEGYGVVLA